MSTSSNIFASNVFYSGNVFGPTGEQLTQSTALTQKIQDFAGGFSNGIPGIISSTSVVGTGVAQSTLNPFGQGSLEGSIYFPGVNTGNYLSSTSQSTLGQNWWSSSGFTCEFWAYYTSFLNGFGGASTYPMTIGNITPTGGGYYWSMGVTTNGTPALGYYNGSAQQVALGASQLSLNTWYHLAFQANGTNIYIFINGTLSSTTAISGTPQLNTTYPLSIGGQFGSTYGPTFYLASARLVYAANLYSQGSFTAPTTPLGPAPTGQTVMLLRNPLYSAMTLKTPLNAQSSVRVRCLPSDALIYLDAYGSNMPNKAPLANAPTFDPYGTGAVLFRNAQSQYLDFGPQTWNIGTKGFTVVAKVQFALAPQNYERIFEFQSGPSVSVTSSQIIAYRNATGSTFNWLVEQPGTTSVNQGNGSTTISQDVPYVLVFRYDPTTQFMTSYVNGVRDVNLSVASTLSYMIDRTNLYSQIGRASDGVNSGSNMNLYTFAAYNRALTDKEITDASAMLTQVSPVVPSTLEIGNVNGRPALTVDPTGSVNVLGPLNGPPGGFAPTDLGISSLSLATGSNVSNIVTTSFSPLGPNEGSLFLPSTTYTYLSFGPNGTPFPNANIFSLGDVLCETWIYPISYSNYCQILGTHNSTFSGPYFQWFLENTAGYLAMYVNQGTTFITCTPAISMNTWTHVAFIYQSSTKRLQMYANGQPLQIVSISGSGVASNTATVVTFTGAGPVTSYANPLTVIGAAGSGTQVLNSYITNLRVVTGSGAAQIYNNNAFTPSTSPLFPASNTAGGSLTTNLLVRVPRIPGKVQTQKLIGAPATGFSGVQAFPPAPMTGYATNLTGLSPYGQGTYVASASSEYSGFYAWGPFDKTSTYGWASNGTYNSTAPYSYAGTVTMTDVTGTAYLGEWVQVQMASSIVLSNYSIAPGSSNYQYQGPARFWIFGSRDGVNWYLVDSRTGITTWASSTAQTFSVSSGQAFSYFRLVVNQLDGYSAGIAQVVVIYEWTLNGSIEGPTVSADGRLGVGVSAPVQQLEVAGSAVVAGTLSAGNPITFKNRLINGNFNVWQRGTTFSSVSAGTYTADRWCTGGNAQALTAAQSSDTPLFAGFQYSLSLTTTFTSGSTALLEQRLERVNSLDFYKGTPFVISFWAKQTAGTANSLSVAPLCPSGVETGYNAGTNATTPTSQNATLSSSWTYYTMNFAISSASVVTNGLYFQFYWLSAPSNPSTVLITGVQLEKGTIATPFEVRPYATELALCQRYYEVSTGLNYMTLASAFGATYGSTTYYKVTKRANPTVSLYDNTVTGGSGAAGRFTGTVSGGGGSVNGLTAVSENVGPNSFTFNGVSGYALASFSWNSSAEL